MQYLVMYLRMSIGICMRMSMSMSMSMSSGISSIRPCVASPGGYSITAAWSQAGLASAVQVKGKTRQEDILFDCGTLQAETLGANHVFITHSHVDHIGAVIMHARVRTQRRSHATYYIPPESVGALEEAKVAFEKLDGGEIVMKIKPVQPGDCIRLSSSTTVKVLRTTHRVPSQGYAIFSTQPGKLKEEYRSKTGQELKELRSSGADLKDADTETLEMVYTGDTTFESLLLPENACMLHAPVLIMEMTYLDGPHEKAIEYGHIHIDDVVKYAEIFQNSHIVFCHLSSKYAPHGRALKQLQEVLPEQLQSRAYVMLKSFGSHDMVTRIAEVDLERMNKEVGWGWAQKVPLDAPSEVQLASSTTPIDESSSAVGTEAEAVHSR